MSLTKIELENKVREQKKIIDELNQLVELLEAQRDSANSDNTDLRHKVIELEAELKEKNKALADLVVKGCRYAKSEGAIPAPKKATPAPKKEVEPAPKKAAPAPKKDIESAPKADAKPVIKVPELTFDVPTVKEAPKFSLDIDSILFENEKKACRRSRLEEKLYGDNNNSVNDGSDSFRNSKDIDDRLPLVTGEDVDDGLPIDNSANEDIDDGLSFDDNIFEDIDDGLSLDDDEDEDIPPLDDGSDFFDDDDENEDADIEEQPSKKKDGKFLELLQEYPDTDEKMGM